MDAVTALDATAPPPRRRRFAVTPAVELGVLGITAATLFSTYSYMSGEGAQGELLSPVLAASLLLANLLPAVILIVLLGRRIARHRAAKAALAGGGRMHVRLVALFSLVASVPIILTVIAASVLFQSGVQLWGSKRSQAAFESTIAIAKEGQKVVTDRWTGEARTMARDLLRFFPDLPRRSPELERLLLEQTYQRNLYQSVLFEVVDGKTIEPLYAYEPPTEQEFRTRVTGEVLNILTVNGKTFINFNEKVVWVVTPVDRGRNIFLYVGTPVNADFLVRQTDSAREILSEYQALQARARTLQITFNAALYGVALFIIGLAMWIAIIVADRLVQPVDRLVIASRRVSEGDFSARVTPPASDDEIATLGRAFNTMTERLQIQTNALVTANVQLESRRALIEAVMSGVTAGVISIDRERTIRLINASAAALLRQGEQDPVGKPLHDVAPELDALLDSGETEAVVQTPVDGAEARTLAVKVTSGEDGQVLTFDDITQQQLDQRRAAWSDVARRIAHEIKNPLTPIQLAAERLQRRYGKNEDGVFSQLTSTIVRQVGDLRRMVDEFSSFARMPKPLFRAESLLDIARQSMFLHEVAHPAIRFAMQVPDGPVPLVCDRRQLGQALTNVVKNAVEAIEARPASLDEPLPQGEVVLTLAPEGDRRILLTVADNGIGLPVERDRIAEPYMTTRARGTGLGLAIVKKIVEEHFGSIAFGDRPGGGTIVTICFDAEQLAALAGAGESPDTDGAEPRPAALTRTGLKA
ncbi:ATP-binding protein [Sphingomonas sp.]|uniref:sensor histidine kinase NtrY-like n=1 Tax=Sphingomonas sp. TaxID=28214 RepID=UPI001B10EF21|nr:ATP-binding protein [Sphingomonas sp.]MBO9711895.1 HAMP domain-containing protein [Sphingomonas sp.]